MLTLLSLLLGLGVDIRFGDICVQVDSGSILGLS